MTASLRSPETSCTPLVLRDQQSMCAISITLKQKLKAENKVEEKVGNKEGEERKNESAQLLYSELSDFSAHFPYFEKIKVGL
jgi:hypothetical protein